MSWRGLIVLLAPIFGFGCLPTNDFIPPRYFVIEAPPPSGELTPSRQLTGVSLRLKNVQGAAYLKERLTWRRGGTEAGFYEHDRWAENPADALDRILAHRLFETCGFTRTFKGGAESLEVYLIAADEVQGAPREVAIKVRCIQVTSDHSARWEETFRENVAVERAGAQGIAEAMGMALGRIADRVALRVMESLKG